MTFDLIDAAVSALTAAGSTFVALKMFVRAPKKPVEPICAGYYAPLHASRDNKGRYVKVPEGGMTYFSDCRALRSKTCNDGRCTYHCRQMCKCDDSWKEALK